MESLLTSPFVQQYGPLGLALAVVVVILGGASGTLWWLIRKLLPALNKVWSDQIAAERAAREREQVADRDLYRESLARQQEMFREIHKSDAEVAASRHAEILGRLDQHEVKNQARHGELTKTLDTIETHLRWRVEEKEAEGDLRP